MRKLVYLTLMLLTPLSAKASNDACMQSALFYEANTEGFEGMLAVASVIMKRTNGNASKICKVVKKRDQFSWVGKKPIKSFTQTEVVSQLASNGMVHPKFKNATHFHDVSITPAWAPKMKYLGRVKRLKFYEEI